MPIDFTKPAVTDNYATAFVPNINNAIVALGMWLDPGYAGAVTSPPNGAKRYGTGGAVEQFNGTSWVKVGINGITFDGTNSSVVGAMLNSQDLGFVNQHDGIAAAWYGRFAVKNATGNVAAALGTRGNGTAAIAGLWGHNNALSAYADLYLNTTTGSDGGAVRMGGTVTMGGHQALHAGNYNNYAPTLTGAGASGSWGISVTGSAGSVAWSSVTGRPTVVSAFTNDAGYITGAGRAFPKRSDGTAINFYWNGQGGQPAWLWGSDDGVNFYVWNPSSFNVNYATSAGSAGTATTATSATSAVTAANGCAAWVNFNGVGTVAIKSAYNVSSITDIGPGEYTANFTNALADSNYSVCVTGADYVWGTCATKVVTTGGAGGALAQKTASACRVGFSGGGTPMDSSDMSIIIFR